MKPTSANNRAPINIHAHYEAEANDCAKESKDRPAKLYDQRKAHKEGITPELNAQMRDEAEGRRNILCTLKSVEYRNGHSLERHQMKLPKGFKHMHKATLEESFPKEKDRKAFQRKNHC